MDKIITGFFVITLGALWYCSVRYHIRPKECSVVIYDVFGKETSIEEIRTDFKTREVAKSYILEYQKRFPHYSFSMATESPEIKNNTALRIFKKNYR